MAQIIAIHSFRRGTGKTLLAANIGALLAADGRRVALIDADFSSPALHLACGLTENTVRRTLNDYLLGRCDIEQTAHDIWPPGHGRDAAAEPGRLAIVPASPSLSEIARMLRQGYDLRLLDDGIQTLVEQLRLDAVIVDTHAGLYEEALVSMALADVLALVLRHDQQDYQGTAVMVDVARRLDVPRIALIANQVPQWFDPSAIREQVERSYGCLVAGVLPHSGDIAAEQAIFALRQPQHPQTARLRELAAALRQ